MVGREPIRKDADERIESDSGVFVSRDREGEQPTEIPLSEPTDIDPTADPLPYRGQTVEPDQPYQSRGMPISPGGLHEETPIGIPGEDPLQPVGPARAHYYRHRAAGCSRQPNHLAFVDHCRGCLLYRCAGAGNWGCLRLNQDLSLLRQAVDGFGGQV
jgi:hypothetical protein